MAVLLKIIYVPGLAIGFDMEPYDHTEGYSILSTKDLRDSNSEETRERGERKLLPQNLRSLKWIMNECIIDRNSSNENAKD